MAREKKIHRRTIRSMEDLVSRISSVFLNLRIEDTNDGINEALKLIGTYFRADRAYLFLLSEDKTRLNNTHEWCSAAAEPQIDSLQDIPVSALPWWMERLSSLSDISVSEVSAMPEEASAERKMLEAQGIRSFLVTPLGYSSRILGFFGLDFLRQSQD
jgi:two-component system cell cycle sensor histidine kinase/response regulator CckA